MDTETRAIRMSELQLIVTVLHRRQSHASTIIIMVRANDREPDRALVSHIIAGFSDRRESLLHSYSSGSFYTLSCSGVYMEAGCKGPVHRRIVGSETGSLV